jgi:uncharacterized membrane protein
MAPDRPSTRLTARMDRRDERSRLDIPATPRRVRRPNVDPDSFGRFSESVARYFGTARFIVIQTLIVGLWITANIWLSARYGKENNHFDPYPFILLNLVFSTQAAYAAPLILLAQNRQADRDRVQYEQDRRRDERSIADTEYLVREVAGLRIALGETATRDYLRSELRDLLEELDRRDAETGRQPPAGNAGHNGPSERPRGPQGPSRPPPQPPST